MSTIELPKQREVLLSILDALRAEAHHLSRWPELTFPQLHNELYHKRKDSTEVMALCQSARANYKRTWLRCFAPDKSRSPHLKATLAGHEDLVHCCRFSPCSRYLASASLDGTLRICEVASGEEIACLKGSSLRCCCWSPDGRRIATGGDGSLLRIWEWREEREVCAIDTHARVLLCCDWSPDGNAILSEGNDGAVVFWDAVSTDILRSIPLDAQITASAFSPDGSLIGVCDGPDAYIFSASLKDDARLLFTHRFESASGHTGCSFSRDGKLFAHTACNTVVIDTEGWSELKAGSSLGTDCALSPDGAAIVSGGGLYGYAELAVYNAASGKRLGDLVGHQDIIVSCTWSPDGRWIASASRDGTVKIWDASIPWADAEGRSHTFGVADVSFNPDASMALSAGRDGRAHLWNSKSGSWIATVESRDLSSGPSLTSCDFSPDEQAFVISDEMGVLEVFDTGTRKTIWKAQAYEKEARFCAWSPAGDRIASCGSEGIKIWNAQTGELLAVITESEQATRISFSPDGRRLAADSPSSALIFHLDTFQLTASIPVTSSMLRAATRHEIAWSSDGAALIFGASDRTAAVIDPSSPGAMVTLSGHREVDFASAYFGPYGQSAELICALIDGHRFAVTAYVDGLVKVWDIREERLIAQCATDAAFCCLSVSGHSLCLGDDQGYLHWFSLENLWMEELPDARSSSIPSKQP